MNEDPKHVQATRSRARCTCHRAPSLPCPQCMPVIYAREAARHRRPGPTDAPRRWQPSTTAPVLVTR